MLRANQPPTRSDGLAPRRLSRVTWRKKISGSPLRVPLLGLLLILIFIPVYQPLDTQAAQQSSELGTAPIHSFQLIDQDYGWVLAGNSVFMTANNGDTWEGITPPGVVLIRDIQFLDSTSGFLVSEELTEEKILYTLFSTTDGGLNWVSRTIAAYQLGQPEAENSNINLFFLDGNHGWIVFRRATSANFNVGTLLRTTNGGLTWEDHSIPIGDPVAFTSPTDGMVTGGLNGHSMYITSDGGVTWKPSALPYVQSQTFFLPYSGSPSLSIASITDVAGQTQVRFLRPLQNLSTWEVTSEISVAEHSGAYLPTSSHLAGFSISTPAKILHYTSRSGELQEIIRTTSEEISQLSFINHRTGWALAAPSGCTDDSSGDCNLNLALHSTTDGGQSWARIAVPLVPIPSSEAVQRKSTREATALLSRTAFMKGQGYDQCEISSLSNLQSWRYNSPLSAVNLYIGGVSRACANINLNKEFVEELSLQGWKFIPTWVGQQASCTHLSKPMNENPTIAFNQGQDNAIDAARVAMKLGLSEPDQSGTVIYYDLEAFDTTNAGCLKAAKAFINGWVSKLHEFGVTAGLYGSVCASALDEMYSIPNPPDAIWPALWVSSSYNSSIDVYGLPCISDSQWGDQQRIYQYTGAHWETWGNTSMNIDLDAIDGIVADISRHVGIPPVTLANPSFENSLIAPWKIILSESACTWSLNNNAENARSGSQYLAINRTDGQTECFGINQPISLTPQVGDKFRFSVWARSSTPGSPRSLTLDIHADGASPELTSQKFTGIKTDWACLEVAHTVATPGQTSVTPAILLEDLDGVDLYLDDAHLSLNTGRLCPNILSPTNLNASDHAADDYIFLDWDQVPFSSYYKIYRKADPAGTWELLDRTSNDHFLDTTGDYLDEFYYSVKACDAGGCSNSSNSDLGSYDSPFLEFWDGFESGNTDRWTWHINSEKANLCATGRISGDFGFCLDAGANSPALLAHNLVSPTDNLTASFLFDPNSFSPDNQTIVIFALFDNSSASYPLSLALHKSGSSYQIQMIARSNTGVSTSSSWVTIPDQPVQIEINWQTINNQLRSIRSVKGAVLYINGNEAAEITGIDISGLSGDQVRLGGVEFIGSGTASGVLHFDNLRYFGPSHLRQSP